MERESQPVAVIGAGPVGLAAAAHLAQAGESFVVLEAGASVAASMLAWGHVRIFSPWRYNVDPAAVSLLQASGWSLPEPDAYPTGAELATRYLMPLAALPALQPHIRLGARVTAVSRHGFDKMKTPERDEAPFAIRVLMSDGAEQEILARAVIDASGTYESPNPIGASGLPALGERVLSSQIFYGIPDVLNRHRARYAGKRVAVVGSGHSAFDTLLDLTELAATNADTEIWWLIRRTTTRKLYGGGTADELPARGALGERLRQQVEQGRIRVVSEWKTSEVRQVSDGVMLESDAGDRIMVDEIVATTGFRPDLEMLSELRLNLDPAVEAPSALAPLIDPNVHSCGSVPPHGAEELKHPEQDFYIVGIKSYGRAPTFLMLTGYEQVRSVVAAIRGDWTRARAIELTLPETGVCTLDTAESSQAESESLVLSGAVSASVCC